MSKVVIFGPRLISPYAKADKEHKRNLNAEDLQFIFSNLEYYHQRYPITEVVSGLAKGVDSVCAAWGVWRKIPVKEFPYLSEYGKQGGIIRNREMATYADRGVAFWDYFSTGTKHMLECMEALNKPVTIWRLNYFPPVAAPPQSNDVYA